MGQALICPKCKAGLLRWVNDDIDEADLSIEPMQCKNCKKIYKGFNEFDEAIGFKLKKTGRND